MSSYTLDSLGMQIMQHFEVATYDQTLIVNDRQLTSAQNNLTLEQLEIEPNTTIALVVSCGSSRVPLVCSMLMPTACLTLAWQSESVQDE